MYTLSDTKTAKKVRFKSCHISQFLGGGGFISLSSGSDTGPTFDIQLPMGGISSWKIDQMRYLFLPEALFPLV